MLFSLSVPPVHLLFTAPLRPQQAFLRSLRGLKFGRVLQSFFDQYGMGDGFWFSAIAGLVVGGIYILLVYLSFKLAAGRNRQSFMMIVFGGMMIRLFVAAAFIALIVALAPVSKVVFLLAFFGIFLIGLILEVVILHRHQESLKDHAN